MELIDRRLEQLEREITNYDPDSLNKKQTKAFLVSSSKRLSLITDLMKDSELLEEIPDHFLLATDSKLQSIRMLMQAKKVNPEHMSFLNTSILAVDMEDERENLTKDDRFDEDGMMRIDIEDSLCRKRRLKKIENKFEYVNLICSDLQGLVEHQTECIQNLEGNYDTAAGNTGKATAELSKYNEYKKRSGNKICAVIGLMLILMVGLGYFLHVHFGWTANFSSFKLY